mmetsp:Transcript_11757/g.28975  ORF Transcript_11757/g.28975 Transcript_11757/m.28975 type:complete len:227 (-) Transcript_11757:202-882(-)
MSVCFDAFPPRTKTPPFRFASRFAGMRKRGRDDVASRVSPAKRTREQDFVAFKRPSVWESRSSSDTKGFGFQPPMTHLSPVGRRRKRVLDDVFTSQMKKNRSGDISLEDTKVEPITQKGNDSLALVPVISQPLHTCQPPVGRNTESPFSGPVVVANGVNSFGPRVPRKDARLSFQAVEEQRRRQQRCRALVLYKDPEEYVREALQEGKNLDSPLERVQSSDSMDME